ncbi:SDR family NAD(P)-dependent oxidoreductase [Segnochrobactrum spirostomi]|uniref:SDR family NAD(P)-dependent oxidoreductase n=1 Tax=Segnochrobactrum spirostomi TaxID=2608987 RepID=A0A6A7Y9N9_9HYPH|nr:SDR family NAD(P)-dependent oxidoreductase [Segnochrobactrum spirostomi]MQT14681.1 SDR family NAD(P)-dependent oxidoreductase [Segnochrobactrum spirostomi]
MKKWIAVLGAGPGLGASIARKYGEQGYGVALVARRLAPLEDLAAPLRRDGIETATFTADVRSAEQIASVFARIKSDHGPIDVLYYGPNAPEAFVPASSLTVEAARSKVELFLYGLIAAVGAVLPDMRAARGGTILVGLGGSAAVGLPFASGPGPALSAARNYLHSLHGELAHEGIYVGMLTLSAIIRDSGWHAGIASGEIAMDLPPGFEIPEVDPGALAEMLWQLAATRETPELIYPPRP